MGIRDIARNSYFKNMNVMNAPVFSPVFFPRTIKNARDMFKNQLSKKTDLTPTYIRTLLKELEVELSRYLPDFSLNIFRALLYSNLSTKVSMIENKFNKVVFKFVVDTIREKYITSFYDKKYDIKFDLDYSFEIQTFNEFLSFFDKYQPNKIYEQDNFYFFNITKESIYNYESFKIKKDYNLENYFAIKNINIKNINYKNTFQLRPASAFSTSFERFFNENEQKNIFYRFELQKWGVYNFSEDIMYANEGSHKDKNKHQIEHIIPGDYIIYHNIFLDNFNNKKYLASLCLFIIYIVIMKSFFCFRQSINENRLFFIFSIIIYFIYNQIIHTSFLTEKSFYYLFTIFYIFLILKKKEIIKKQ